MNILSEPTRLTLYVDGSCDGNQNVDATTLAGWGVVVVEGDSGLGRGSGEIQTELSGPVSTSPEDEEFIGAEVGSNNTAELSGLFAALRWLLTEENEDPVCIRLDSQYAGNIATGAWRAKANRELAARVQSVWNEVASQRELSGITFVHIVAIDGTSVRPSCKTSNASRTSLAPHVLEAWTRLSEAFVQPRLQFFCILRRRKA